MMTKVPTFTATIYVGLRRHYAGEVMAFDRVEQVIQEWVDRVSYCVTCTRTNYIYKNGNEPGIIVGFINYPRFPADADSIRFKALDLAQILLRECHQMQLSIVFPDETLMLSNQEEIVAYQSIKK
jgi:hypothetical protein